MSFESKRLMRITTLFAAVALVAACGGDGSTSDATETTSTPETTVTTVTPETTTTVAPTTTTAPVTTTLPDFPKGRTDLVHGEATWAVVLAGAETADDPVIAAAEQAASDAGYTTGWTDCDEGAAEALGMPAGTITLSVYFETKEDAELAAAAFAARGVDGVVAEVRTFCLD